MTILAAFWAKFWPYLALIGAAFAAFVGIRQSGKAAGKQEIRNEINESQAKARKEARRVEDENAALDGDGVDSRLKSDWLRNRK